MSDAIVKALYIVHILLYKQWFDTYLIQTAAYKMPRRSTITDNEHALMISIQICQYLDELLRHQYLLLEYVQNIGYVTDFSVRIFVSHFSTAVTFANIV